VDHLLEDCLIQLWETSGQIVEVIRNYESYCRYQDTVSDCTV